MNSKVKNNITFFVFLLFIQCQSFYGPSGDSDNSGNPVKPGRYYPLVISQRIFSTVLENLTSYSFSIALDSNYNPNETVRITFNLKSPSSVQLSPADIVLNINSGPTYGDFNFKIEPDRNFIDEPLNIEVYANGYYQFSIQGKTVDLHKLIFVTQNSYKGNLGGLQGADWLCNQEAKNIGASGYFKAMLNLQNIREPMYDWFFQENKSYSLNQLDASNNLIEVFTLGAGQPSLPPTNFLNSISPIGGTFIWTGVKNWSVFGPNCSNWTDSSDFQDGAIGDAFKTMIDDFLGGGNTQKCSTPARLICIQQ